MMILKGQDPMWKPEVPLTPIKGSERSLDISTDNLYAETKSKRVYIEDATSPLLSVGRKKLQKVLTGQLITMVDSEVLLTSNLLRNNSTRDYECVICEGAYKTMRTSHMKERSGDG